MLSDMKKFKKPNIGVLTFSESTAAIPPLSNLLRIVNSIANNVFIITGKVGYSYFSKKENICAYVIEHESDPNTFIRIFNYLIKQFQISYKLVSLSNKVDWWILSFNADTLLIPIIVLKLLRKRVILALPGSTVKIHTYSNTHNLHYIKFLTKLCHRLSDNIILYSQNLVKEWDLEKYTNKISFAHEHIIDSNKFSITIDINKRKTIIGYVGRLSEEKGIINFLESIRKVIKLRPDIEFLIIGDGPLLPSVQKYIIVHNLNANVTTIGWVSHDDLPAYYNILKLLVIPSYTEGLPNTMLEAMSCGTPILANSVGSIPDIIKDNINGFMFETNSPDNIASGILRSLNEELTTISKNARMLIMTEFSYEGSVDKYIKALEIKSE